MYLKVIRGLEQAKRELHSVDPLNLDSLPPEMIDKSEEVFGERLSPEESVQRILQDVRQQGDSALRHYARLLDGFSSTQDDLEVSGQQIDRFPAAGAGSPGEGPRTGSKAYRGLP